mgnify:CR=1 FL=1
MLIGTEKTIYVGKTVDAIDGELTAEAIGKSVGVPVGPDVGIDNNILGGEPDGMFVTTDVS